jgi:hypothetical protein
VNIFYVSVIEQNAGFGSEWFMDKAFRSLGHSTYCVDYREHRYRLVPYFWNAPPCDVFFLQRGDYFPLQLIKSVQTPRFFWASELVSRCRDQDRLLKSGLFSHIFMRTPACIEAVVQKGWVEREQCSILLSSFDENLFRIIPGVEKDIQVLFVGSLTPRRKILLDQIKQHFPVVVASAFGEELVRLLNRAKIVLNIHADEYLDTETRVYETLGCRAFLLSEQLSPENPFTDKELVQAGNFNELTDKIDYYLRQEDERAAIAEKGYRSVHTRHTYVHRAQEIVHVMYKDMKDYQSHGAATVRKDWRLAAYRVEEASLRFGAPVVRLAKGMLNEYRHRHNLV